MLSDLRAAVFGCQVALREEVGGLRLAPGGIQVCPLASGSPEPHPTGGIGDQHLMWAADSAEALDHFAQLLKEIGY